MSTTEYVNKLLEKLPLAPYGVENWIYTNIIENTYIIFDNKQQKAACTRCGKKFPMKYVTNVAHNTKTHCPKCGASAEYKANHYGRKKLTEYFRVLLFTHRGKTVYGTLFEIIADFSSFGRPVLSRWLSALYVFKENEQHYYKHHAGWLYGEEHWTEQKKVNLPAPPRGSFWYPSKFDKTELYMDNLENVFKKSCLKYHYDRDFFEGYEISAYGMVRYISATLRYQAIELLRKAGFERLVVSYIAGHRYKNALYIRGKTLKSILRLPKRWHKKVRDMELDLAELRTFQNLSEPLKEACNIAFLQKYDRAGYYREDIERFVPFEKAVLYTASQNAEMVTYRDYLECAYLLGEELNRNHNLYPKNLLQEHDRVTAMREVQGKGLQTGMQRTVEMCKEEFPEYRKGSLLIRIAESQQELNKESRVLTHCVKTYGEKMAKGKTYIFLIRKIEDSDTPYYTLELSPEKKMLQCQGEHNCSMTDEVKAFVDEWLKEINKKSRKKEAA